MSYALAGAFFALVALFVGCVIFVILVGVGTLLGPIAALVVGTAIAGAGIGLLWKVMG